MERRFRAPFFISTNLRGFIKEFLDLLSEIEYPVQKIISYIIFLFLFQFLHLNVKASEQNKINDSLLVDSLYQNSLNYEYSNPVKAKEYIDQALDIARKSKLWIRVTNCYLIKGFLCEDVSDYGNAINNYNKALELSRTLKNKNIESKCLNNIGLAFNYQGYYLNAFDNLQQSLKIREELKDSQLISISLLNLGLVHTNAGNKKQALKYLNRALKIKRNLDDKKGIALTMMNIGNVLLDDKEYIISLKYFEDAMLLFESLHDELNIAYCKINLGQCHFRLNKESKAILELKGAEDILTKIGDVGGLSYIYISLSEIHRISGRFGLAEKNALHALEMAKVTNNVVLLKQCYSNLFSVYDTLNDSKKALYYYKNFIQLNDSLLGSEKQKRMEELEVKFQTEKNLKQIESQRVELEKKNNENTRHQWQRNVFLIGFFLLIIISVVSIRSFLIKRRANLLLSTKNAEIVYQNAEIESKTKQLEKINKELEYLSIVASRTDNAIIIADKSGQIEWVNGAFIKLYGYNLKEYKAKFGGKIFRDKQSLSTIFDEEANQFKSLVDVSVNYTKEGSKIWIQTTLTPVLNEKGKIQKLVAIDSDITKLKSFEEELIHKGDLLAKANHEMIIKNNQITDSISYAKILQDSILPKENLIRNVIPGFFKFYKPRDIVSGDFIWYTQAGDKYIFALGDCTGHGVPGALMSMLGTAMLNEIVKNRRIYNSAEILTQLNHDIFNLFNSEEKEGNVEFDFDNSIDISVCIIDLQNNILLLSMANHQAFIKTEGEFKIVEGSICSIGGMFGKMKGAKFFNEEFDLLKTDILYLYTDGFQDQFNAIGNEKYMTKRMHEFLQKCSDLSPELQANSIEKEFLNWKGDTSQVDDVTIMGIDFSWFKKKYT